MGRCCLDLISEFHQGHQADRSAPTGHILGRSLYRLVTMLKSLALKEASLCVFEDIRNWKYVAIDTIWR